MSVVMATTGTWLPSMSLGWKIVLRTLTINHNIVSIPHCTILGAVHSMSCFRQQVSQGLSCVFVVYSKRFWTNRKTAPFRDKHNLRQTIYIATGGCPVQDFVTMKSRCHPPCILNVFTSPVVLLQTSGLWSLCIKICLDICVWCFSSPKLNLQADFKNTSPVTVGRMGYAN